MKAKAIPLLLIVASCGGLSDEDRAALRDVASDQAYTLVLCAPDAGDCNAAQVRALARPSYCTAAATLARHGEPVVDAGIPCERK